VNTVLREGCGTYLGLRMHAVSGEEPCSECLRAEQVRRIEHEGIPRRPAPAHALAPVTPEEGARNLAVLAEAIKPQRRAS
jgi:hypothetical protein